MPTRGNPNIRATRDHLAFQKRPFLRCLKLGIAEMMNSTEFLLLNKSQKQGLKKSHGSRLLKLTREIPASKNGFDTANDPWLLECWDYPHFYAKGGKR